MSDSPYLYLTVSQIQALHEAVIEEYGGTGESQDGEGLNSCVDAPQNVAFCKKVMFLSKLPPTPVPSCENALSRMEIEGQRLQLRSYF